MTYSSAQRAAGLLTVAEAGLTCQGSTPFSGTSFQCKGTDGTASPAVHTWIVDGVAGHYCGYHSPFDVTEIDRLAVEARDVDPEFETLADLEFSAIETRRAIDLPAGYQVMMERSARVAAWQQAQKALQQAIEALSDQRLAAYAVYRRRFA